ncbi:MAG: YihY/virulence factor BrkB family protein [Treponema sp.]|jgi:membrane protein|nr:YihY/virulence factor BrkB family protein [Treponema sp.]
MQRVGVFFRSLAQRLVISMEFFMQNSLGNHAAAGAYGFLLSAAPALMIVSFFVVTAFQSSPQAIAALLSEFSFLGNLFHEEDSVEKLLDLTRSGVPGLFSAVGIIWAGRVFALAILRGLKIIFNGPRTRNPIMENFIIIGIELLVILMIAVMVLLSRSVLALLRAAGLWGLLGHYGNSLLFSRIIPLGGLGLVCFGTYRFVPANPPRGLSALRGTFCCIIPFALFSQVLGLVLNQARYNFIYGALGSLVILLVNVYFFFNCYFFGAQMAAVIDSFDSVLFSRLHRTWIEGPRSSSLERRLFSYTKGKLRKYLRSYPAGETVFNQGDDSRDIYFLVSGEAELRLGPQEPSVFHPGEIFGEMAYLLGETRTATIIARTDISTLVLPPELFEEILRTNPATDRLVIDNLSRRLKTTNDHLEKTYPGHKN